MFKNIPRLRGSDALNIGIGITGAAIVVCGIPITAVTILHTRLKDDSTAKVCKALRDIGIFPHPRPDTVDAESIGDLLNAHDVKDVASKCKTADEDVRWTAFDMKEGNIALERSRIASAVVEAAARGEEVNASLLEDSAAEIIAVLQKAGHCEPLYEHSPPVIHSDCIEAAKILGLARNGEPVPRELLNALLAEIPTEKRGFSDIIQ